MLSLVSDDGGHDSDQLVRFLDQPLNFRWVPDVAALIDPQRVQDSVNFLAV
jgi:hypothetical protein